MPVRDDLWLFIDLRGYFGAELARMVAALDAIYDAGGAGKRVPRIARSI